MEKLIELLNKYLFGLGRKTIIESYRKDSLEDVCGTFRGIVEGKKDYPYTSIWGIEVISKTFGFIKWLVENDKIKLGAYDIEGYHFNIHTYLDLLMLLSISDTPIEDLVSYLK